MFITGISNGFGEEFRRTWGKQRKNFPIDVVFGAPIGFDDLRAEGNRLSVHMKMTQRSMDAVKELAEYHREEIAGKR